MFQRTLSALETNEKETKYGSFSLVVKNGKDIQQLDIILKAERPTPLLTYNCKTTYDNSARFSYFSVVYKMLATLAMSGLGQRLVV